MECRSLFFFSYFFMVGLKIFVYYVTMQSPWHIIELREKLESKSIPGREYIDQNDSILCALKIMFPI